MISALPAQLGHDLTEDFMRALELEPDHLSVYGLTVEPRTALARRIARGAVKPATEEDYSRDFLLAHDLLTEAGHEHYEVSNFALKGKRSRHNCSYWDGSRYAGLGPSAHGFDGVERRWNVAHWALYEGLVAESGDATGGREILTSEQHALENVYLGLRVSNGVDLRELDKFDSAIVAQAEERGWAITESGRWRLTALGWLRLDEIATALTTSPEGG
jgi:oxygen-independent coproporphyrinogen-3 oxidase